MSFFNKKKILVTHDGSFHADDLFACAVMTLYFKKHNQSFKIIRTRNTDTINKADYVYDVGGVYDPNTNRFDHHQKDTSGSRANGILYASFGLAWKHFGMELCSDNLNVWQQIDEYLASPIDATDNGMDIAKPIYDNVGLFSGSGIFLAYSPSWIEGEDDIDDIFKEQVKKAADFLARKIKVNLDDEQAKRIINDSYDKSEGKKIVILENSFPRYLLQDTLSQLPDVVYVVYPSINNRAWKVEAVTKSRDTMESRKLLPESWRGLFDDDDKIRQVTGVPDAMFCHKAGFLITAKSKDGAIALAKKALES